MTWKQALPIEFLIKADNAWATAMRPLEHFEWLKSAVAWADFANKRLTDEMRDQAPVSDKPDSGRLRDSLYARRFTTPFSVTLDWQSSAPYANFVRDGTSPHMIVPVAADVLHWVDSGGDVFSAFADHPGMEGNDFVAMAYDRVRAEIIEAYEVMVRRDLL